MSVKVRGLLYVHTTFNWDVCLEHDYGKDKHFKIINSKKKKKTHQKSKIFIAKKIIWWLSGTRSLSVFAQMWTSHSYHRTQTVVGYINKYLLSQNKDHHLHTRIYFSILDLQTSIGIQLLNGRVRIILESLNVRVRSRHLQSSLMSHIIRLDLKWISRHREGTDGIRLGQCTRCVDSDIEFWTNTDKEWPFGFR